jgi:hypothetical protein
VFIDNLAAFTDALGVENAPSVIHLAMVPWPDTDTRNNFILKLTGQDVRYSDGV